MKKTRPNKKLDNLTRRRILTGIGGAGSALLAGSALPRQWTKPVVDAVMLPAHAVGTNQAVVRAGGGGGGSANLLHDGLDYVIPKANAIVTLTFEECIEFEYVVENGKIVSMKLLVLQPRCDTPPTGPAYNSAKNVVMGGSGQVWQKLLSADGNEPPTGGRIYTVRLETVSNPPAEGSGDKLGTVYITRENATTSPVQRNYEPFDVYEGVHCGPAADNCVAIDK